MCVLKKTAFADACHELFTFSVCKPQSKDALILILIDCKSSVLFMLVMYHRFERAIAVARSTCTSIFPLFSLMTIFLQGKRLSSNIFCSPFFLVSCLLPYRGSRSNRASCLWHLFFSFVFWPTLYSSFRVSFFVSHLCNFLYRVFSIAALKIIRCLSFF